MKLKTVHTYQSVRFNQKDETHFDGRIPRFAGIELDYDEKLFLIKVSMPGSEPVLIFPANCAYMIPVESPVEFAKPAKQK